MEPRGTTECRLFEKTSLAEPHEAIFDSENAEI